MREPLRHLTVLAAALGCAVGAVAQNALDANLQRGTGTALDRNSQQGSGGQNSYSATGADFRARNAVVTGNVAGGRGFRGSVGYTAANDFRGNTGSDDLYNFRAGSAFSDPRVARAGTVGDRMNLAKQFGSVEYGRASTPELLNSVPQSARLVFDKSSATLTTSGMRRAQVETETAALYDVKEGEKARLLSGAYRGVRMVPAADRVDELGLGVYETARLKQEIRSGRLDKDLRGLDSRDPFAGLDEMEGRIDTRIDAPLPGEAPARESGAGATGLPEGGSPQPAAGPSSASSRIDTKISPMRQLARGVEKNKSKLPDRSGKGGTSGENGTSGTSRGGTDANGAAGTAAPGSSSATGGSQASGAPSLADDMAALRRQLRGGGNGPADRRGVPNVAAGARAGTGPAAGPAGGANGTKGGSDGLEPTAAEKEKAKEKAKQLTVDDYVVLLKHGQRVDRLSDAEQARVKELTDLAEMALKRGGYFDSEQRFDLALTLDPNNALAKAGVAHSQIGAGLLGSAALSLRSLLTSHPELIDARYGEGLLPPPARLREVLAKAEARSPDSSDAGDIGLLIAYLGHHLDDRAAMEEGLKRLQAQPTDAELARLLRGIWLSPPGAAAPETGAAAPAAPATPAAPTAPATPANAGSQPVMPGD